MYVTKEKIYPGYVPKHNSNRKKKIILMIPKGKGREAKPEEQQWHHLALKRLSALLKRIISKINGGFYCFNFLYSFRTKKKLNHIKEYLKIKSLAML